MRIKQGVMLVALIILYSLLVFVETTVTEDENSTIRSVRERTVVVDQPFRQFLTQYQHELQRALEEEKVPGAAWAIVKDGVIAAIGTYGVKEAGQQKPVLPNTLFRIASLSKGMTGVLAGRAVESGLLNWSSPYCEYPSPALHPGVEGLETLELHHFLTHTTGLPRHTYSNLLNLGRSYANIIGLLPLVEQSHPPGTYHNYQNVLFNLSADMLEAAANKPFELLAEELLFQPLGMYRASVGYRPFIEDANKAMPHRRIAKGYTPSAVEPNFYEVPAAAGVNASINDMARWLVAVSGHREGVLSDSLLEAVLCPVIPIPAARIMHANWKELDEGYYAMGWRVFEMNDQKIIGHSGYVNGFRAEIAFTPNNDLGIVILTNAPNQTVGKVVPSFFDLYNAQISPP
jgi:beta-lactamase class C